MQVKSCCFTGHRPQKLPFRFNDTGECFLKLKAKIKKEILRHITEYGVTEFISGMALGVDTYAAEIVLELKKIYPQIKLICAVPCENQAEKWNAPLRERYYCILGKADSVITLSEKYTSSCMQSRNEYMVDSADYVIAVWDESPSGTGKTVKYAISKGKPVTQIHPRDV